MEGAGAPARVQRRGQRGRHRQHERGRASRAACRSRVLVLVLALQLREACREARGRQVARAARAHEEGQQRVRRRRRVARLEGGCPCAQRPYLGLHLMVVQVRPHMNPGSYPGALLLQMQALGGFQHVLAHVFCLFSRNQTKNASARWSVFL